ncbi:MAG: hypothetical protein FJX29_13340 [Alphaproteobacteria bacterium]|nr:hypothetical protein [Alphaproteobacteria bacterium]
MNAPQPSPEPPLPQVLHVWRAMVVYGIAAFAIGFVLGLIRELALAPLLGRRLAQWTEFPVVTALVCFAAWRILAWRESWSARALLAWGAGGVLMLLALESAFALFVVGLPLAKYLEGFNVARGALFPFGLAIMLTAPWIAARVKGAVQEKV